MTEHLIADYSAAELRGHDAYKSIRDKVNTLRRNGIEPKCIWINGQLHNDLHALWRRACGPTWDGVIPKMIAGLHCRVGSTGGHAWVLEYFDSNKLAGKIREDMTRANRWNAVDDPSNGTSRH